jgi:sortase (surface protein transpeptidase)
VDPRGQPTPEGQAESPALRTLRIPSIGVVANIENVGLTIHHEIGVPSRIGDVAWYRNSPAPGLPGDAIIDGHLDWYTGPAVFQNLGKVAPGAMLEVDYRDGAVVRFRVYRVLTVPSNQPPADLFATSGAARLSLITCAGTWDGRQYSKRLLVEATALN